MLSKERVNELREFLNRPCDQQRADVQDLTRKIIDSEEIDEDLAEAVFYHIYWCMDYSHACEIMWFHMYEIEENPAVRKWIEKYIDEPESITFGKRRKGGDDEPSHTT